MKSRFVEDLIEAHDERARIVANMIERGEKAQADAFGVLNATREKVIIRNSAGTNLEWQGSVGLVKAMYMKGRGAVIKLVSSTIQVTLSGSSLLKKPCRNV